jgi:hypothetical protein
MKSLQRAMLPADENGDVLRAMLDDGDDLTVPRDIEFLAVFAAQPQAEAFAAAAAVLDDLRVEPPEVDDEGVWQVACVRCMPASHAAITALENEVAALAQAHGGYPDGWSCDPAASEG